ncbi:MAG: lectin like domain-containing protein [Coriobacteriia bacterium]|nr:lectin like domain-containing protein [Coriobacteriia bacterium]
MKQQLMDGRGLFITYNCDNYTTDQKETMKPRYINVDTWCQYAYQPDFPSHCVCVVGWDDTIQQDKFLKKGADKEGKMVDIPLPPMPGAWIVKNSWGAADSIGQGITYEPWGDKDSGYFYLSYYDQSLVDEAAFDFNINFDKNKITHQLNYMSSEKLHGVELDNLVTTANIFCADTDEDLVEVSGMTNTENVDVNYKVYLLDSKDQQIDTGKLLCSVDHTSTYKGFHRVSLGGAYHLNKGQYFAVTTTQKVHNGGPYIMSCWYDCNHDGYDKKMTIDDYFCKAIVNPGESFVYTASDGKWTDFASLKSELEKTEKGKYYTYDNFPIKAYATPAAPSPDQTNKLAPTGDTLPFIELIIVALVSGLIVLKISHLKYCKNKKSVVQ